MCVSCVGRTAGRDVVRVAYKLNSCVHVAVEETPPKNAWRNNMRVRPWLWRDDCHSHRYECCAHKELRRYLSLSSNFHSCFVLHCHHCFGQLYVWPVVSSYISTYYMVQDIFDKLSDWCRILFEKLSDSACQKYPAFLMEPEVLSPCS
jgi:hypothetical protein